MKYKQGLIVLFILCSFDFVRAEPWLGNRFAQNCAGCHAPGRFNRKPAKRRCTLTCQGCHVNPNGGGLRNQYGRWTSQRWLRSFASKVAWSKKSVAPTTKQKYSHQSGKEKNPIHRLRSKAAKFKVIKEGWKLQEVHGSGVGLNEQDYDRYQEVNNAINASSKSVELSVIPQDDPYRLERSEPIIAGADFRYIFLNQSGKARGTEISLASEDYNWPMSFDYGFRVKPVRKHVSFVYEGRTAAGPGDSNLQRFFSSKNTFTRSAYVLVDDLPYNSYAQYGLYRPLFGNYNPDHTTMFSQMTGLNQSAVYNAVGIGTAPNVPYGMVNLIMPHGDPNKNQEKGMVITGGLRFVTLGGSVQVSYWKTDDESGSTKISKEMMNFNGGLTWWRITGTLDYTRVSRTTSLKAEDTGSVISLETKYRFWREMYGMLNYSTSDVEPTTLSEGSGTQLQIGAKAFLLSGIELEALMFQRDTTLEGNEYDSYSGFQIQAHFYF